MTDKRPKTVAKERDDISWDSVLDVVDEKREYLKNANRYYQDSHPITNTVIVQQESYPEKLIVIDEIKLGSDNYQYRYGYWVVSDEKLVKGTISVVFGQFALVSPADDLERLHQRAEEMDWEGPGPN